jgi:hypothetical protein
MSWGFMLVNYRGKRQRGLVADAQLAAQMAPLGPAAEVRQRITKHLPGVDWSDPARGVFQGNGFTIKFKAQLISKEDITDYDPISLIGLINMIELHVRGKGNAIPALLGFANPNGWSLFELSNGKFLDPESPSAEGCEGCQALPDKAIGTPKREKSKSKTREAKGKAKGKDA